MKFAIEDAVNVILQCKGDFNGAGGDDFYISLEQAFDDAPIGVDINVCTGRQKEGELSWKAVVYPLIKVGNLMDNEVVVVPDFGNELLDFTFQFTNTEKTRLAIHAFYEDTNNGC